MNGPRERKYRGLVTGAVFTELSATPMCPATTAKVGAANAATEASLRLGTYQSL
jgi:hypothetical protein